MIEPKVYITAKKGELLKSCQDAYCFSQNTTRFAVADGATREFFSAKIAQELVDRFCFDIKDETNINILTNEKYEEWLIPIQDKWLNYVENIVRNEKKKVNFAIKNRFNRREAGASTFVGLELEEENFKTMIIGDSCLFHIRDNKILKCYLIDDPDDFDNSPEFFFSRSPSTMIPIRTFIEPQIISGKYIKGDYFLLASDAISKYFLTQNQNGKWLDIWNNLLSNDRAWYNDLIEKERVAKNLDDDDVVILIISTDSSQELKPFDDSDECSMESLLIKSQSDKKNNDIFNKKESIPSEKNTISGMIEESGDVPVDISVSHTIIEKKLKSDVVISDATENNSTDKDTTYEIVEESKDVQVNELSEIYEKESGENFKTIEPIDRNSSNTHKLKTNDNQNVTSEHDNKINITYSKEKIVVLIFDEEIKIKESNEIKSILNTNGIRYIECTDEDEILYLSGVLILFRKKNSLLNLRKEVEKNYYKFSKVERNNYHERKRNKVFIKKIGTIHSSYDISEIKKELT